MHRGIAAAGILAVFFMGHDSAMAGELLVVSKSERKLAFHDAQSGELLGTAPTGMDPREVVVTPDGSRAFVSDFGDVKNTISVFDVPGRSLIRRFEIKKYYGPHGLAITNDGKSLFVTLERSRTVARLDAATGKMLNAIRVGMRGSHYLALAPDNRWLYVANPSDDNITIIDVPGGSVDRHVLAGDYPEGMAVSPDGTELWIGVQGANQLVLMDVAETKKPIAEINCPGSPTRLEFTPDGSRVLVTCNAIDRVFVFDAKKRNLAGRVTSGATPYDLEIDPAGQFAYVGFAAGSRIGVLNLETLEFERDFETLEIPAGLAYVE
jgi:YVTN family beta-propeller protein